MIRKGRIRGLAKEDPAGQARFVGNPFGIAVQKRNRSSAEPKAHLLP
jgi:hypothetical protein